MFSAVYVFKETVEHLLLSAGEGHHHHPGDEDVELYGWVVPSCVRVGKWLIEGTRIKFPLLLVFITFISLIATSMLYGNHSKLVNGTRSKVSFSAGELTPRLACPVTGNELPPLQALFNSSRYRYTNLHSEPPSRLARMLSNPYSIAPILISACIFLIPSAVSA